jgi:hypothetical protein
VWNDSLFAETLCIGAIHARLSPTRAYVEDIKGANTGDP